MLQTETTLLGLLLASPAAALQPTPEPAGRAA